MPIDYAIDPVRGWAVLTGSGRFTEAELLAVRARAAADPRFDPAMPVLIDLADADLSHFTSREITRLAESSMTGGSVRRAFVTTGDLGYGLMRMYAAHHLDQKGLVGFFKSREAAVAWLEEEPPVGNGEPGSASQDDRST